MVHIEHWSHSNVIPRSFISPNKSFLNDICALHLRLHAPSVIFGRISMWTNVPGYFQKWLKAGGFWVDYHQHDCRIRLFVLIDMYRHILTAIRAIILSNQTNDVFHPNLSSFHIICNQIVEMFIHMRETSKRWTFIFKQYHQSSHTQKVESDDTNWQDFWMTEEKTSNM